MSKRDERIRDAMDWLEQMPCELAIGIDGPNESELYAEEEEGHVYGNDAVGHMTQRAWLCLNDALKAKDGEK